MKTVLEWLNWAKEQGYEWADDAIWNYNHNFENTPPPHVVVEPKSLSQALAGAFYWENSPEGQKVWAKIHNDLVNQEASEITPESLPELLSRYTLAVHELSNTHPMPLLREPYRTTSYNAIIASYEEEIIEVKKLIENELGYTSRYQGLLNNYNYLKDKFEALQKEFEAHKATAEELNRSYINEHNENYECMKKIEQLEMLLKEANSKKMVGWLMQQPTGKFFMAKAPVFFKENESWNSLVMTWIELSEDEVKVLTNKVINWSDDEPTPIYK